MSNKLQISGTLCSFAVGFCTTLLVGGRPWIALATGAILAGLTLSALRMAGLGRGPGHWRPERRAALHALLALYTLLFGLVEWSFSGPRLVVGAAGFAVLTYLCVAGVELWRMRRAAS